MAPLHNRGQKFVNILHTDPLFLTRFSPCISTTGLNWNLVAELDALNACTPLRTYAWGVDLSGSMSGAGGVGGLLMVKRHMRSGATDKSARYLVHSDANGNVKGFASIPMSGTTFAATLTGQWDYDAFGNRVSNTIPVAHELCRIGFSSKYEDPETGWLNYTFRIYRPDTGAWLSRDPIGERGGVNLYGFVGNDPVSRVDYLGLIEPNGEPFDWNDFTPSSAPITDSNGNGSYDAKASWNIDWGKLKPLFSEAKKTENNCFSVDGTIKREKNAEVTWDSTKSRQSVNSARWAG